MKKKQSKDIILIIILIPLFLWGAFFISSRMENKLPRYTVINKAREGYSVFYEALKDLKYPVERTLRPISEQDLDTIQIVTEQGALDINGEDIKAWVKKGGKIVFLSPRPLGKIDYEDVSPIKQGSITNYNYHKGKIIVSDVSYFTNEALMEDVSKAYNLVSEVDGNSYKKIYFNEYNIFVQGQKRSLWDYTPLGIRIIVYQLALVLIALYYYKGKRFGKPIPLYEEVERSENEYVYSTASIYRQANCWDIMVESYYTSLLKEMNSTHEQWLESWERKDLPSINNAKKVYDFMNNKKEKYDKNKCLQIINTIEELKSILTKRRDSYWKTWKTTK